MTGRRAIATAGRRIKIKSFTIDGAVVVLGPDGSSLFDELRRREAADTAILYAFGLIERDGKDMRNRPFLDFKTALARLLRDTEAGIRSMSTSPRTAHRLRARLPACCQGHRVEEGRWRSRVWSRSAIPPAPRCSGRRARCGTNEPDEAWTR
jgi:ATP-dependent DNA ligase